MGHHARSEALFYYFRLEDQVPETHLLRVIDKHVSFELRILLIGYLYGITSERKLVEELRMHLAWRWFTGLGFDQEIPHHSTFSKNRRGQRQRRTSAIGALPESTGSCYAPFFQAWGLSQSSERPSRSGSVSPSINVLAWSRASNRVRCNGCLQQSDPSNCAAQRGQYGPSACLNVTSTPL
jgi:hypothetical protein